MYVFGGDNYATLDSIERWNGDWEVLEVTLTEARDWMSSARNGDMIFLAGNHSAKIDWFDAQSDCIGSLFVNYQSDNSTLAFWNGYLYSFQTQGVSRYYVESGDEGEIVTTPQSLKWWSYTTQYWNDCLYIVMGGNEYLWQFNFTTNDLQHLATIK